MVKSDFETLEVYQLSEELADQIWHIVIGWAHFSRITIGNQLVRAADNIGADIAGGTGHGTFTNSYRSAHTARASLYETNHWLKRAYKRNLLTDKQVHILAPLITELTPRLDACLQSTGNEPQVVAGSKHTPADKTTGGDHASF